jgi:hypothetical protein
MSTHIDRQLERAQPTTTGSSRELDAVLQTLVGESERTAAVHTRTGQRFSGLNRRTKVLAAAALATIMIGTASAALATQPWRWSNGTDHPDNRLTVTFPSGRVCEIRAVISEADPARNPDPAAIADARTIAKSIDMRTFDVARLRADALSDGTVSGSYTPDEQASFAIADHLSDLVFSRLDADGFADANVSVYAEDDCGVQQ